MSLNEDEREYIRLLADAGVDRQTLAQLVHAGFDLPQVLVFLQDGGTVDEVREQARRAQHEDDLHVDEDIPESPPVAQRSARESKQSRRDEDNRRWHEQERERLQRQQEADNARAERQRATSERYRPRQQTVYIELNWYDEVVRLIAQCASLFIAWLIWRIDAYFTLHSARFFQPVGVEWAWLATVVIWPPFAMYAAMFVPLAITAVQAAFFPTKDDLSAPQRFAGLVVTGVNWITSSLGLGIYLWGVGLPYTWLAIPLAMIGGFLVSVSAEWIASDAVPGVVSHLRSLWGVCYHNTRVYVVSEPPLMVFRRVVSHLVFWGVLVGWLRTTPGTFFFPAWGLSWEFLFGVVLVGLGLAAVVSVLIAWGIHVLADRGTMQRVRSR